MKIYHSKINFNLKEDFMIQSNYESVEEIATKMEKASDSIRGATIKSISVAEKTTLNVNESSRDTNKKAKNLKEYIHKELKTVLKNMLQKMKKHLIRFEEQQSNLFPLQKKQP